MDLDRVYLSRVQLTSAIGSLIAFSLVHNRPFRPIGNNQGNAAADWQCDLNRVLQSRLKALALSFGLNRINSIGIAHTRCNSLRV